MKLTGNQVEALPILLHKLRNAQIDNMDAVELIKRINKKSDDAFMFVNPPYYNSDCGHYKGYTESDFVRLLDVLAEIAAPVDAELLPQLKL